MHPNGVCLCLLWASVFIFNCSAQLLNASALAQPDLWYYLHSRTNDQVFGAKWFPDFNAFYGDVMTMGAHNKPPQIRLQAHPSNANAFAFFDSEGNCWRVFAVVGESHKPELDVGCSKGTPAYFDLRPVDGSPAYQLVFEPDGEDWVWKFEASDTLVRRTTTPLMKNFPAASITWQFVPITGRQCRPFVPSPGYTYSISITKYGMYKAGTEFTGACAAHLVQMGGSRVCGTNGQWQPDNIRPKLDCPFMVDTVAAKKQEAFDAVAIAQKVNQLKTTWTATPNPRFHGRPKSYIRQMLNARPIDEQLTLRRTLPLKQHSGLADTPIPDTFDSRVKWPECRAVISNIRDQSACGSCWAVAAAGAMSDRLCIASQGNITVSISASNLMSCCWTCGYGCSGGYSHEAWKYFAQVGLVTGGEYGQGTGCQPYPFPNCIHDTLEPPTHRQSDEPSCSTWDFDTPQCLRQCQPFYNQQYDQDTYFGKNAYRLPADEETIQREIMTYGSVEALFRIYADFITYQSGVYQHVTGRAEDTHDVRIIGWGVEQGTPYWLIANSWNEQWGEKGYVKFLRGSNECNIENGVVAGEVTVD